MSLPSQIETERLLLRRWREDDIRPFADLNADPQVMEFFPNLLTADASIEIADRIQAHFTEYGYGWWSVEVKGADDFAGIIGIANTRFQADFTPAVEIGWRLAAKHWGMGLATEGARAVLDFAFRHVELDEVVSMTTVFNRRSRRIMEKLGMTRNASEDFNHPFVPPNHKLCRHVLYRIARP